jgi:hypothetical protein
MKRMVVDSITWEQRHGMHASPQLFCIVAQQRDLYSMIAGNEEGCKDLVVIEVRAVCWC